MTDSAKPRLNRRILLVDDIEAIQRTVDRVAEKRGHQVICALTGAAALEAAITAQPDIIVLDTRLPDADGRDVLNKLKADQRTTHTRWSFGPGERANRTALHTPPDNW